MPDVRLVGDFLVLMPGAGPNLPTSQALAMPHVPDGIEPVVGNHVLFARLTENREHDIIDLIAEQMILQMAIEWANGGIILRWVGRALLEIDREKSDAIAK